VTSCRFYRLIGKKVKNIFQSTSITQIEFRIFASLAGNCSIFFPLNIEYFTPETASRTDFTQLIRVIGTFGALITECLHFFSPVLSDKEFIKFLYYALGSIAELETQLIISQELGFLVIPDELNNDLQKTRQIILGLIRYLKSKRL